MKRHFHSKTKWRGCSLWKFYAILFWIHLKIHLMRASMSFGQMNTLFLNCRCSHNQGLEAVMSGVSGSERPRLTKWIHPVVEEQQQASPRARVPCYSRSKLQSFGEWLKTHASVLAAVSGLRILWKEKVGTVLLIYRVQPSQRSFHNKKEASSNSGQRALWGTTQTDSCLRKSSLREVTRATVTVVTNTNL